MKPQDYEHLRQLFPGYNPFNGMILPNHILKLVSKEDRKKLGKAGLTSEEALAKAQIKSEKQLQIAIVNLLRLRGIEPIRARMDKKTTTTVGTPDILFAIQDNRYFPTLVYAFAWEVKFGQGKLSKEQEQMIIRMSTPPNGWLVSVIRSVDEAIAELRPYEAFFK